MSASVHVDGTARIQSVQADTNPLYTRLIGEFAKGSSVPMINTSLNINEQPTVNALLEALHTYFCSGLDALYLGPTGCRNRLEIEACPEGYASRLRIGRISHARARQNERDRQLQFSSGA
jgi:predicted NodU family carbamoyl transferase